MTMNAKLILEVNIDGVCLPEDLKHFGMTLPEMVRHLIKEEGHFAGFIKDDWKIISVEERKDDGETLMKLMEDV